MKTLVGYEGSEAAQRALELATCLAGQSGEVGVVHVVPSRPEPGVDHEAQQEELLAEARKLVDVHVADNNRMPCGQGAIDWADFIGTLEEIGYDDYLTVEFVVPVDRSRVSQLTEIADASEAEASVGLEQFLRDHGTGAVPDALYDRFVALARAQHAQVATGRFGADMQVHLVNDGPVTIPMRMH